MARHDVIVVGGGVSGTTLAFHAARAGRRVLLLEREARLGGCLHTAASASGFWLELGAHTCYNSYGALIDVLDGCGLLGNLQPRAKPRLRFLEGDRVLPGENLALLLSLLNKGELVRSLPGLFGARQEGRTVREYYSRIVGPKNYARVLGPMLSAVPSQRADDFPAEMLFKKRPRRKDVIRSFTLPGGLQRVAEAAAREAGVTALPATGARGVERLSSGFAVTLEDGSREEAGILVVATPPGTASALLAKAAPEVSGRLARIRETAVDTLGLVLRSEKVAHIPPSTFLIPLEDVFHSVVTRDVVPDPTFRGFAFHFKPHLSAEDRLRRATQVLGVARADVEAAVERRAILPSPVLGHRELVADVDRLLAGTSLALTGNWFAGLSIEDCVQRSRGEWARVGRS